MAEIELILLKKGIDMEDFMEFIEKYYSKKEVISN